MSVAKPSNNGKSTSFWGVFRREHPVEPIDDAALPPREETPEELTEKAIDRQIEHLQELDSETHAAVMDGSKKVQKKIRRGELRMKRLNGGLTKEEEAELHQEN